MDATVLSTERKPGGVGCDVVTVYYEYAVGDAKYGGWQSRPFLLSASADDYVAALPKGTGVKVRVNPRDSAASFLLKAPWRYWSD